MSVVPPGGKGTIRRMGLLGYASSACAIPEVSGMARVAAATHRPSTTLRRCMDSPNKLESGCAKADANAMILSWRGGLRKRKFLRKL
ncbi:hypothetical protein D3C78_1678940 [compost metagenome]